METGIKNIFIIFILSLQYSLSKGQIWSALGQGLTGIVFSLAADTVNNIVYAGGNFQYMDQNSNDTMNFISKWDGKNWLRLGNGNELIAGGFGVTAMMFQNNELYVGGDFGSLLSLSVAKWNNVNWQPLALGLINPSGLCPFATVYDFALLNNQVIAGGCFDYAHDTVWANRDTVNCIAKWNGTAWDSLGSGVNDATGYTHTIEAIEVYNSELYAAGWFESAGGVPVNNIARWNGTQWSAVNSQWMPFTHALCAYNGALYLGGLSDYIYQWDGTDWDTIATLWAPDGDTRIFCLEVYQNQLVAGGQFNKINGIPANNIAKWDGVNWTPFGAGTGGISGQRVEAAAVLNNELYVGGWFQTAGGIPASYVAKWGGCGPYVNFSKNKDTVNLTVSGEVLFTNQSTGFDSLLWNFGDGTTDTAQNPTHIYDSVGIYTVNLTGYKDTCLSSATSSVTVIQSTDIPNNYLQDEIKIYSIPFNKTLEIEFEISIPSTMQAAIYNYTGTEIISLQKNNLPKGKHNEYLNTSNLSPGIYLLIANINAKSQKIKIIKL